MWVVVAVDQKYERFAYLGKIVRFLGALLDALIIQLEFML